jgi:glycosyltransferase involved in cell wall biosynthesis
MKHRLKILWMSDPPTFFTGFGTVTKEILTRLSRTERYQIACLGWGYDGWPYDRQELPFDIYPSNNPNLNRDTLAKVLEEYQPHILVTLGDVWMIDWITDLPHRSRLKFVPYFPLDGEPLYPPWGKFIRDADVPVTYSRFAQNLVQAALPDVRVELIYHGVDTTVFHPIKDREHQRPGELKNRFIVGCVARNQPRKNLPTLIKAFARFCRDKPEAVLYLHTNPVDIGWDILDLLKRYRVFDRTCISKSASIQKALAKTKLNEIYNLFDVMVLPTAGEGFGLPILEAMAAGVPVIATNYTSCVELLEGRGELIAVKEFLTAGRHNIEYAIPDIDDLVAKLNLLYSQPELRKQHSKAGLEYARTLDWDEIVKRWDNLLIKIALS